MHNELSFEYADKQLLQFLSKFVSHIAFQLNWVLYTDGLVQERRYSIVTRTVDTSVLH